MKKTLTVLLLAGILILSAGCGGKDNAAKRDEYNDKAWEALMQKDLKTAMEYYDKAVKADPNHFRAYVGRAEVHMNNQDYEKAIEQTTKAIELDPSYGAAYNFRALAHRSTGDFEKAEADFLKAIEVEPSNPSPRFNLGVTYFSGMSRPEEGLALITEAIEGARSINNNTVYNYLYTRAMLYAQIGEKELAVADIDAILEKFPGEPGLLQAREAILK